MIGQALLPKSAESNKKLIRVDFDLESDEATFSTQHFVFHVDGLSVKGIPSYDDWVAALNLLATVNRRIYKPFKLWVCQLVLEGEKRFGDRYTQAMDLTGLSYSTLANAMVTTKRYLDPKTGQIEGWHADLSFEHHKIVDRLPPKEREAWLKKAEREQMNTDELRGAVFPPKDPDPHYLESSFTCPDCGVAHHIRIEIDRPAQLKGGDSAITIM